MLGERIDFAAKKVGGRSDLAKISDVSLRTLNGYIAGERSPQVDTMQKIASGSGVELYWLLTGIELPNRVDNEVAENAIVKIPRYNVAVSAGSGALVDEENAVDFFSASREWVHKFAPADANLAALEATGDSMEPTISDGNLLIVNLNIDKTTVANGGVFVITVGGRTMLKRLQIMLNGDVSVRSDNPLYEPETISGEEADELLTVHGKVIWSGGAV